MKPLEIAITREFNLGNYQTVDFRVRASLDEGENPTVALEALEKIINDYWAGRTEALVARAEKESTNLKT